MPRWLIGAILVGVVLGGPSRVDARRPVTIVALGDSTTAGAPGFRAPLEDPPAGSGDVRSQYAYWIRERHPEWRVHNHGVTGQTTEEILARFDRDVVGYSPDVVIILAGVNDLYRGLAADEVTWNLQQLYERAALHQIPAIACTILPYQGATAPQEQARRVINAWIRATVPRQGLRVCDTARAVADPNDPRRFLRTPDGLHPDVEGYRRMAEALLEILEPLVDQRYIMK